MVELQQLDDRRARRHQPCGHAPPVVDRGGDGPRLPEPHLARALHGLGPGRRAPVADKQRRNGADGHNAGADELHRLAAVVVAVGRAVAIMKTLGDLIQRPGIQGARRDGNRQLVGLALVARIDRALEAPPLRCDAGPVEHGAALLLQRSEHGLQRCRIGARGGDIDGAHIVALEVGADEAQRREGSGDGRTDDLANAELGRQRRGMQRSCPSESRQHEVPGIVAALHGYDLQRLGHGMIDDVDDGRCRRAHVDAQRFGEPPGNGCFRRAMIDRQLAGEQRALVEIAEQQVAVGDGRLAAAARVAHGARIGAGALGADTQRAGAIHPGNRSATRRHLGEIDDRHADRMACAVHPPAPARATPADLVLRRRLV